VRITPEFKRAERGKWQAGGFFDHALAMRCFSRMSYLHSNETAKCNHFFQEEKIQWERLSSCIIIDNIRFFLSYCSKLKTFL
jgi:hypothetical protein